MKLRILCTNDFLGSLAPMRTSYGTLPGGEALQHAVARLREGQPTVWADAGDFSQGGPLSTTTGGVANFQAAGQLGIEVATVGNHELDWGLAHLDRHRGALPFPLICANLDLGLPASALIATAAGPVGFVGLTHPQVDAFTPHVPAPEQDLARIVPEHAERLRAQGAVAVVALIHFGVNWSVAPDGEHLPDPTPALELCAPFAHAIDAVVLGHTLGRWSGVVEGLPYAQPWAFGAELGVIDLDLDSGEHTVELVEVQDERLPWTGAGAQEIQSAQTQTIGHINTPLSIDFAKDISLAHFAAEALRLTTGASGAIVPVVGMHQPAIAGVMYEWPAGPVTEADLSRLWPWTDDRCLLATVGAQELAAVCEFVAPEPWLAWGTSVAEGVAGESCSLVVPRDYVDWATVQIAELLGRQPRWQPSEVRLRDAVRALIKPRVASC